MWPPAPLREQENQGRGSSRRAKRRAGSRAPRGGASTGRSQRFDAPAATNESAGHTDPEVRGLAAEAAHAGTLARQHLRQRSENERRGPPPPDVGHRAGAELGRVSRAAVRCAPCPSSSPPWRSVPGQVERKDGCRFSTARRLALDSFSQAAAAAPTTTTTRIPTHCVRPSTDAPVRATLDPPLGTDAKGKIGMPVIVCAPRRPAPSDRPPQCRRDTRRRRTWSRCCTRARSCGPSAPGRRTAPSASRANALRNHLLSMGGFRTRATGRTGACGPSNPSLRRLRPFRRRCVGRPRTPPSRTRALGSPNQMTERVCGARSSACGSRPWGWRRRCRRRRRTRPWGSSSTSGTASRWRP